jgi:CarboxypepD_reg-like domain/Secretion system C-terminal sorting domain
MSYKEVGLKYLKMKTTIMKNEILIHIPEPCHEDWNKMTPTQQGRHCQSCCKQVIDFSAMTDAAIINYFAKGNEKICGRFANDQLLRPLQETKIEKKKGWQWFMATITSLFLLANRSNGQASNCNAIQGKIAVRDTSKLRTLIGDTIYSEPKNVPTINKHKDVILRGHVTDEKGEPVPFASIIDKGTKNGVAADANGGFLLKKNSATGSVSLVVSAIGFKTKEITVNITNGITKLNELPSIENQKPIIDIFIPALEVDNVLTGEVIVTTAGGAFSYKRPKKKKPITAFIQKVFVAPSFRVYPNPATKNAIINIEVLEAGQYHIELLDEQSKMLYMQAATTQTKKQTLQMQLPTAAINGIYYIRLINTKTNKAFTQKILIQ